MFMSTTHAPFLGQMNPVHANLILFLYDPVMSKSTNRSHFFRLPHQNPASTYVLPPHVSHVMSLTTKLTMQFFPHPIASSLLGPKNLISTLNYALLLHVSNHVSL